MLERSRTPPFPDVQRTGRIFISPCCTAGVHEFSVDGVLYLAGSVAGHGWSAPWLGCINDINDTGTLVDADGSERPIRWSPAKEKA